MKRINQHGFTGIEGLLLLGTFLLLVGIGTYIYARSHGGKLPFTGVTSTPVVYTGSQNSTSPGGVPAGAKAGPQSTSIPGVPDGMTLVKVPEAGFSITVPNSIKDLTYHAVKGSNGLVTVTFSTASLTAAAPGCAADIGNGAFDTVTRGNGSYPGPANPGSGGLLKQYSGYYLAYTLPSGPCAKNLSSKAQILADTQAQDFYTALSSVKAL